MGVADGSVEVLVDANGIDVYNAQLTDVDLQSGQNRYLWPHVAVGEGCPK
jgi:hypothetical protein